MYLCTLSFKDGYGTFSIYRLFDGEYFGILQGRPQKLGPQVKFFRGTTRGPEALFFSNSIFPERTIMAPGPTFTINVKFGKDRLVRSAAGAFTDEDGTKTELELTGIRKGKNMSMNGFNQDIYEQQQALIQQLELEQKDKAAATALIVAHRGDDAYVAHPGFQHTYKWVGNRLVKLDDDLGCPDYFEAMKLGWRATWGKLFTKEFWGLGQAPAVKDPWGVKTYGFPIAVRKEVELEEELKRIHQEEAPYADEFMHGFMGNACVHVFRVDNLASGDPRYPVYAIPYKDKFGSTQIVTCHKHPHLAVEEFKRVQAQDRVSAILDDFDERAFGYDMKMLLYSPCI